MGTFRSFVSHFLALCIAFISPFVLAKDSASNAPSKVALEIYFYDDVAIDRNGEDLFERMFAKLRPDITYRRISIKSSRWGSRKKEISDELRVKITTVLGQNEHVAFLLIDTHGSTVESNTGRPVTSLGYLGKIYESGVDPEFAELFAPIKDKAEKNLQIILNSCSTFCGGQESAAQRGKALLNYFGATEGGIYGSDVDEISQKVDHPEFIKWQYLVPNLKTFLTLTVTAAVLMLPVMSFTAAAVLRDQVQASGSVFEVLALVLANASVASGILGTGMATLGTLLKPVFQFISSRVFLNRGYYFALENGRLSVGTKVIKYKVIKNIIAYSTPLLCQNFLSNTTTATTKQIAE